MLVFRVRTFGVLVAGMLVIAGFMLSVFRMFVNDMFGIAQSGSVFGAFVGGVGFEFGSIRGTMLFDFFGFFFGEFGFRGGLIFGSVEVRLFLAILFFGLFVFGKFCFADEVNPFGLVFFKFGATDERIGFRFIGSLLMFGFGQFEREGRRLLFVQFDVAACGSGIGSRRCGKFERRSFVPRRICAV